MRRRTGAGHGRDYRPQAKVGRFDQITIALHWLSVALVTSQVTTAWLLDHGVADVAAVLAVHRSLGTLTWVVVVARLTWRHTFAHLPPFPDSMPKLQQHIAKLGEYGLYALLLLQPLSGMAMTLFRGRPFTLFWWQVPALLDRQLVFSGIFRSVHEFGAASLLVLIGLHTAAALLHGLVLRDGVLQRMLPWTVR